MKEKISVKGRYSPRTSSPVRSDERYTIKVRRPLFEPPENYFGSLIFQDDIVGKIIGWCTPGADHNDLSKLYFAVRNYKNFTKLKQEYQQAIQSSPFVQWALIPFLLGAKIGLEPFANNLISEIKSNKDFFHFLVENNAKYKHCLAGAYGVPSIEVFTSLLEIYGVEASIPEGDTLNLIQLSLTSHYDNTALDKIKALFLAGANINARIDEAYQNTVMHYIIALEHNIPIVIKFIDFIENIMPKISQCKEKSWDFDYTIQDKFGKTSLLLAVGLNATQVVEKLLKNVLEKNKKDIGLNIPDVEGRTPCMIAAALGHLDILKQLIKAGADCYVKDKQGRDLMWYANAPGEELSNILKSVSVHPDRIACVNNSYLYSSTREAFPVVLVEENTKKEHLLLLSRQEPHFSLLKIALKASLNNSDPELKPHYLMGQAESFLNKPCDSILQFKMKNQPETRRYVQEVLFRLACAFGDLERVEKIGAEKYFNLASCDQFNRTAMHYAVMTKKLVQNLTKSTSYFRSVEDCLKNHAKVFEYLINKNSTLLESKNVNGNTPLDLLQRDVNDDDKDNREQAQLMLDLLKENSLLSNLKGLTPL